METVFTMIGTITISFSMQKQSNLQMDFTFCLDGAVWASRARHTSIADGEPKFPTCAGCVCGRRDEVCHEYDFHYLFKDI
jgi:hypothetical protein